MVDWWQAVSEVGPERPKIRKSIMINHLMGGPPAFKVLRHATKFQKMGEDTSLTEHTVELRSRN